ncbi:MAG: hypothetical protein QOG74_1815, partial [Alphaproteobacteria bacterium]|nr:hypothetical protein [Alphaproteobacteria bacterium]
RIVRNDPDRRNYMDAALAPVEDGETETLEMITHNKGARDEVARTRKSARGEGNTEAGAQVALLTASPSRASCSAGSAPGR